MNTKNLLSLTLAVTGCLLTTALAQPKPGYDPSSTHVFPAGARRGTTVDVRVGTECAPPRTNFWLYGDGVSAPSLLEREAAFQGEPSVRRKPTEIPITYPREWHSRISIADDAPVGTVFWRLTSAQGGTASRPFIIGDLPEHIEAESNSLPERAEKVTLPVTLNGQICGERDVDYYRFTAQQGQTVSCEVMARRLGSVLDPLVEIQDANGHAVDYAETHLGNDPLLIFNVPADGEYLLRVANVTFHGSPASVYRVNLTDKPRVLYAFPPSGRAGTEQEVTLHAIDGSGESIVVTETVTLPTDQGNVAITSESFSGSVTIVVDQYSSLVETEPNDDRATLQPVELPTTISGRFLGKRDEDWVAFTAAAQQRYTITCASPQSYGSCLPTLRLTNSDGKQLAKVSSVESSDRVCRIEWQAPADGTYYVRAADLRHGASGGADFVYSLTIEPAAPDFSLELASDNYNLTSGGEATLQVTAHRHGGFEHPIELQFEGLPEGVTVESATIPAKQKLGKVKLKVSDDVPARNYDLRVIGTSKVGEQTLTRVAAAFHLGRDSERISIGPATVDRLSLTVKHKPVFRLECLEAYQYAHRGTVYPYLMSIHRLDGFDGEIILQRGDRQNRDMDGIDYVETLVPGTATESWLPIYLPETMHINVQSQSQLYSQAYAIFEDKHGQQQSVLVLSEKRNMLRTRPPVAKLRIVDKQITLRPGETATCRVELERTSNFLEAMRLELRGLPEDSGVELEPIEIRRGQSSATATLRASNELKLPPSITIRGVGNLQGGDTLVVSEDTIRVAP